MLSENAQESRADVQRFRPDRNFVGSVGNYFCRQLSNALVKIKINRNNDSLPVTRSENLINSIGQTQC